jgi:peptide/nickel transport system substrate-binding protein
MKNPFKLLLAVLKTYDYRDRVITAIGFAIFLLMIVKMIVFPYGLFGFGETNIYTEGLVARNGIQNINPLFVAYNEADREVSALVFSGLMRYDPDKQAVVEDMATLTVNEDKTEYTFELREGLQWHDDKPVTADDVFFTFNDIVMHASFPNEILKTNFAGVEIEQLDDRTTVFRLEKPNVFFISNLVTGILPKHILEGVDPFEILQHEFNKKPIGSGPYMVTEPVEEFQDGRTQITLNRNPHYYGEPSEVEFMRFVVYPTMEELLEGINAVNGVVKVTGKYILDFENNERFELIPYELPQYSAVFFNMDSLVFKDEDKVRLALQKAIDKDALFEEAVDKVRVDTPLMELSQDDWEYQSDLEEAEGALKDSGFEYSADDLEKQGLRYNDDDEALEVSLIARLYTEGSYQAEETFEIVEGLRMAWEQIGVGVRIEFLPLLDFNERIMQRHYDVVLVGQNLGYNLDTYSYWHSSQANPSGLNLSNYKSFQVDAIIEDIRSVFDLEKRKERLAELAEKLKEDVPAVFLFRPIYYYASDDEVIGIDMSNLTFPSDRFARMSAWSFEE